MATCRFLPHISYVRLSFYKYSNDNKIQQVHEPRVVKNRTEQTLTCQKESSFCEIAYPKLSINTNKKRNKGFKCPGDLRKLGKKNASQCTATRAEFIRSEAFFLSKRLPTKIQGRITPS